MPQVIHRNSEETPKKPGANDTAVVRHSSTGGEVREISPKVVIAAGVAALLLILFLFNLYIHPFVSPVKKAEHVPPLPGFADEPPYNIKEWQEAYKKGRATPMSGVPRGPAAGLPPVRP